MGRRCLLSIPLALRRGGRRLTYTVYWRKIPLCPTLLKPLYPSYSLYWNAGAHGCVQQPMQNTHPLTLWKRPLCEVSSSAAANFSMNSLPIVTSASTRGMIIDIDADAFMRRRRIIELQQVLPDIEVALREVLSDAARAELEDSKRFFEKELKELLEEDRNLRHP